MLVQPSSEPTGMWIDGPILPRASECVLSWLIGLKCVRNRRISHVMLTVNMEMQLTSFYRRLCPHPDA
jgi:hypothetical protein